MTPQSQLKWSTNGETFNSYKEVEGSIVDLLPPGIYEPVQSMFGIYLRRKSDSFTFTHKVYGVNENFIRRCVTTYENSTGNLGILLNGIKGTGKTVTAKILANTFNLPIIVVSDAFDGDLFKFLEDKVRQPIVVLFDEFEKVVTSDEQKKMLTFMDGISSGTNRKIFILTTNKLTIDENLMSRPSRIRYSKSFGNLSEEVLREVAKDMLTEETAPFTESLIEVLKSFSIITMDNVVQFIHELNIHKVDPKALVQDFNIVRNAVVSELTDISPKYALKEPKIIRNHPDSIETGENYRGVGRVMEINEDATIEVCIYRDLFHYVENNRKAEEDMQKMYFDAHSQEEKDNRYINLYDDVYHTSKERLIEIFGEDLLEKYFFRTYAVKARYEINDTFDSRMSKYDFVY